jgi:hypothetical protein
MAAQVNKKEIPCKDLHEKGQCRHGDKCHYKHPDDGKVKYKLSSSFDDAKTPLKAIESCMKFADAMSSEKFKKQINDLHDDFLNSSVSIKEIINGKDVAKPFIAACRKVMEEYIKEKYKINAKGYVGKWHAALKEKCKEVTDGFIHTCDEKACTKYQFGVPIEAMTEAIIPSDDVFIAAYTYDKKIGLSRDPVKYEYKEYNFVGC